MDQVAIKPAWKSSTLWFNFVVLVLEGVLRQLPEIQEALPLGGSTLWSLLLGIVGNVALRLFFTRQPITEAAAAKPMVGEVVTLAPMVVGPDKEVRRYAVVRPTFHVEQDRR